MDIISYIRKSVELLFQILGLVEVWTHWSMELSPDALFCAFDLSLFMLWLKSVELKLLWPILILKQAIYTKLHIEKNRTLLFSVKSAA